MRGALQQTLYVLPTVELIDEYRPVENLLRLNDTSLREIVEYVITHWACENHWSQEYRDTYTHPVYSLKEYLCVDFLGGDLAETLNDRDYHDLKQSILTIGLTAWTELEPLLEGLQMSDAQVNSLRVYRWLADDIVLETHRSAICPML
jgi:hypothetical protein